MNYIIKIPFKEDIINMGLGIEDDGIIILHKLEAFYLNEIGLTNFDIILNEYEKKVYNVFKFFFKRGYPVRFSQNTKFLRVQRKGFRKREDRTQYLVKIVDEINKKEVFEDLEISSKMRKELIYVFVNENDMKFMGISRRTFP